jgi:glutaredoxin
MRSTAPIDAVDVYWRPGCGFCTALRRSLRRAQVPVNAINIWDDPAAAARVRSVANGNETVPTVMIGTRALVAPSHRAVIALLADDAPHLLPEPARSEGLLRRARARWHLR